MAEHRSGCWMRWHPFSFLTRFQAISKGVIDVHDLLYFLSFITAWLMATAVVIDLKKAD